MKYIPWLHSVSEIHSCYLNFNCSTFSSTIFFLLKRFSNIAWIIEFNIIWFHFIPTCIHSILKNMSQNMSRFFQIGKSTKMKLGGHYMSNDRSFWSNNSLILFMTARFKWNDRPVWPKAISLSKTYPDFPFCKRIYCSASFNIFSRSYLTISSTTKNPFWPSFHDCYEK